MARLGNFRYIIIVILLMFGLWGSIAAASESLSAKIKPQATLEDKGQVVRVVLNVRCPSGYDPLEAFVYVTQEGNESDFAFFPLTCNDKVQKVKVRVPIFPDNPPFHRGAAQVSGYVLLENPTTGDSLSISPVRIVKLR
jgi:hypothetical protein